VSYYERDLPHWQPQGAGLFLTWRLHDSLPKEYFDQHTIPGAGREFVRQDRVLDKAEHGPVWLKDPRVAESVAAALQFGETNLKLYELQAWVIMSNHVHLMIGPKASLARINRSIRGYTAHQANRILGRTRPFWQHESYDHWSRNAQETERIIAYIEGNPVTAGLVNNASNYRWSSAFVA